MRQSRFSLRCAAAAALFAAVMVCQADAGADAGTGEFFGGVSLAREWVDADYTKGVRIDVAPASFMEADDDASDQTNALAVRAGYRGFLSERVYWSGDVEATIYMDGRTTGFLQGTGLGDRDVWPGSWELEKNRSIGVNVRLGYVPQTLDFLGEGRSLYLLTGIRRLDVEFEADFDNNAGVTGTHEADDWETSWVVGAGVEFGDLTNRFDLRVQYTDYELDHDQGSGSMTTDPALDYEFDVDEWGLHLGYSRSFGFGAF